MQLLTPCRGKGGKKKVALDWVEDCKWLNLLFPFLALFSESQTAPLPEKQTPAPGGGKRRQERKKRETEKDKNINSHVAKLTTKPMTWKKEINSTNQDRKE